MWRRLHQGARWLWDEISTPPHMKPIYAGVYVVTVLTGVATLVVPPQSIAGPIGPLLAAVWASCFIVGGILGLCTVLTRLWWLERAGLGASGLGLVTYGVVVVMLHFEPTSSGSRLTQLGIIILAAALFLVRWFAIKDYSYEPRPRKG